MEITGGVVTAMSKGGPGIGGGSGGIAAPRGQNGRGGDGGKVTITGGTVTVYTGLNYYGIPPVVIGGGMHGIGDGGSGDGDNGSLTLGDMKVSAGRDEASAQPVEAANDGRENACRSNKYAKLTVCTDHTYENGACKWCGEKDPTPTTYTITVSAEPADGGEVTGGGTVTAGSSVTVTAKAAEGCYFVNWTENGTRVSTKTSYEVTADTDHALVAHFAAKTAASATVAANDRTYDGTTQPLVTVSGVTGGEIGYSASQNGYYGPDIPTGKDADTYTVWYRVTGDDTHADLGPVRMDVTISRKAVTVTAENLSKTYGEKDPTLTATVSDPEAQLTYKVSRKSGDNAGTYKITAKGDKDQGNYTVSYVDGTFTIHPKTDLVTVTIEGSTGSLPFDGDAHTVSGYKVTISDPLYKESDFTFSGSAEASQRDVGKAWMGLKQSQFTNNSTNFESVTFVVTDGYQEITKKAASLRADSLRKTYGDPEPDLTVTSDGVVDGEALDYSISREVGENAGTYAITVIPGENPNYDLTVTGGTFTIDKAVPVFTVTADTVTDDLNVSAVVLRRSDESIPGTLALTESSLAYGTNTCHWVFTPEDTQNYEPVSGTVEITVTGHVWNAPTWEWTQRYEAYATFTCRTCGTVETVKAKIGQESGDGWAVFTATAEHDGKTFRDVLRLTTIRTELPYGSDTAYPPDPVTPTQPAVPTSPTQPDPLWKRFRDVAPGAWYLDDLGYVLEQGYMNGTSATTFEPNLVTSRAMIVTILYRLEGEPAVPDAAVFDDVPAGSWYGPAVAWAQKSGIVKGYGNGKFGSTDPITREQLAAILYRYAQYKGYNTAKSSDLSQYTDAKEISCWALPAMQWANAEGLINGRTAKTLAPKGQATRAELAATLRRFAGKLAG